MVRVECFVYREKTNNVFRYSSKTIGLQIGDGADF